MPQISEEQLIAFQAFMAKFTPPPKRDGPDPAHRGVIDPNFVRPAPREYPRMMHHVSGMTKIVENASAEEMLGKDWHRMPQKRKADWKTKLSEVFTKSGFRVMPHHVEFLKLNDIPGIATAQDAVVFLDVLDDAQQTSFFEEAESFDLPSPMKKDKKN